MTQTTITVTICDTEVEVTGTWENGEWDDPSTMPEDYDQASEAWFAAEGASIGGVDVWEVANTFTQMDRFGNVLSMTEILEKKAREKLLEQEKLV